MQAQTLARLVQLHNPPSGVYDVTDPCSNDDMTSRLIQARCDMQTEGGGWTVILRRRIDTPAVDFNQRVWDDYENGFGDLTTEFWLGLRTIHCLTQRDDVDLMIDLRFSDGNGMTWIYELFEVAGSNDHYRLHIGNGRGPEGGYDAMAPLNGSQFSTRDSDHDNSTANCAAMAGRGGWWHSNCFYAQLTGSRPNGMFWYEGTGVVTRLHSSIYSFYQNVEMKIRPKNCNLDCPDEHEY